MTKNGILARLSDSLFQAKGRDGKDHWLGQNSIMGARHFSVLGGVVALFATVTMIFGQTSGRTYEGSISISGTVCNTGPFGGVFCSLPLQSNPMVAVHATGGGTFRVLATSVEGVTGPNRWNAEWVAGKFRHFAVSSG